MAGRRRLLFLTTCSDDSKLYMIIVALIKGFQNHIGFAIIRASGEEWRARKRHNRAVNLSRYTMLERVNGIEGPVRVRR